MSGAGSESEALTLEEALGWIAEMFEESSERLEPGTGRGDIPAWDSLGQLVLMSGLDQRFGIRLNQTELGALSSVNDILDVLRRHHRLAEG